MSAFQVLCSFANTPPSPQNTSKDHLKSRKTSFSDYSTMNAVVHFVAFLFLLPMNADAFGLQQRLTRASSVERHLQREENASDAATTDFLADVTKAMDDPAVNLSTLTAFVDGLVANASASNESPFNSNWTSMIDRSDALIDENHAASTDGDISGSAFTPSPEMSTVSDETNASISFDQVVGATFSASGDLENTIGDANMADGANISNNLSMMQLPSRIVVAVMALHTVVLIFKMTN